MSRQNFPYPGSAFLRCCAVAAALAVGARARADQLVLNNGDHLTGKLIKRENGKVYFHSDILGDIVAPENLVTVNVGKPPSATPSESLAGLPPQPPPKPPPPPPAAAPAKPSAPPQPIVVTAANTAKPRPKSPPVKVVSAKTPWTGKVEFGEQDLLANGTRTSNVDLRASAERTVGPDSYLLQGDYLYTSANDVPSTDQDLMSFQWRHQLDERLFTQSLTSYSSDKIRLINDDADQTLGLGYKLFETPRQTVDVGLGATEQYLDATDIQQGFDYLGTVFQDFTYKINGRYTFLENATAAYSPQDRASYGVSNGATGLGVPVETENYDYKFHATLQGRVTDHLSLNLHFDYEFDHAIADPAARASQGISTTVGYAF